ncbi:Hypothetical protein LUCI_3525 [Lucifera butyrica]|uniref:Putative zinc ribbon domain-containing protein n=1 Tax=Lucifera butyrica TaxID=1351585 RepID=A0A498R9P1_9FIRM|nr:zinc ribbon domain-containing protein [Lucifera butyrica]VBB08254.1 Hypothetical protein LUCI_3525 [Lucifera butyrica]
MKDPFCQSCGMPLSDASLLGTEKTGEKNRDYCFYCYENGCFKQPDITMEQMIEICVPYMKEHGMEEAKAREILNQQLPQLKRWKKGA